MESKDLDKNKSQPIDGDDSEEEEEEYEATIRATKNPKA